MIRERGKGETEGEGEEDGEWVKRKRRKGRDSSARVIIAREKETGEGGLK